LTKKGTFVNPLREHRNMPPGEPVLASELERFAIEREKAMAVFQAPTISGREPPSPGAAR
jgi:hypothetical protein